MQSETVGSPRVDRLASLCSVRYGAVMAKRTLSKLPSAAALAVPSPSSAQPAPNGKPAVALPFRPVASQVTHDVNPVLICLYEARTADGRIIQLQLTNGLNAVTWDGTVNEDGSPKVNVNANVNVTSSWKPAAPVTETAKAPTPTPPAAN